MSTLKAIALALGLAALALTACSGSQGAIAGGRDAGTDATSCQPKTCAAQGAECGTVSDGCGSTVKCGTCAAPDVCGAAGQPNVCGCVPTTCAAQGKDCGTMPDGCGGVLDCGSCPANQTCGGGNPGAANVCGTGPCTTKTSCAAQSKNCGTISDGCSSTLDCGSCTAPEVCGGGGQANVCACKPTTCGALGDNCGTVSDGCGHTLDCGSCAAPETCGGGGIPHVCGGGTGGTGGTSGSGGTGGTSGSGGTSWSGILAPSRAIDWSKAGLPATFPDGETTSNPWTPPARTQCGSTLSPLGGGQDDSPQINAALAACGAGHYVLLGSGTFTLKSSIKMNGNTPGNNVTLRGSGAGSTILVGNGIDIGASSGGAYSQISTGLKAGSTQVVGSTAPPKGTIAWFTQCDTGYSAADGSFSQYPAASPCLPKNGAHHADNGGLFVCGLDPVCDNNSTDAPSNPHYQEQWVLVTGVTGSGPYTITFSPGLYLPNWSTQNQAVLAWQDPAWVSFGMGVEDLTLAGGGGIGFSRVYASWVKGVRFVGPTQDQGFLHATGDAHCLIMNNYFYNTSQGGGANGDLYASSNSGGLGESDDLFLNNILQEGIFEGGGSAQDDVYAYNFSRDSETDYPQNSEFMHAAGSAFILREGNQMGVSEDDDTWGTHNLNTWFRNYYSGWDPPYPSSGGPGNIRALWLGSFARFDNAIGNVIGSRFSTNYQSGRPGAFVVNGEGKDKTGLTEASFLRWGNYAQCTSDDTGGSHCNTVSWCGDSSSPGWSTTCGSKSDIPTALTGNAAPFSNPVPSSTQLPASFFMNGMTAHAKGGTGLSWWKVCTNYPSCSTFQTSPMPPIGPDVTGGPNLKGHAYDIPAAIAWANLPIDPSYQNSYTVTGSTWSNGTETLTISSATPLPGPVHTAGGFQLTGASSACRPSSGASYTGRADGEVLMTASSSTTVSYALASNPGVSCAGKVQWPDIRKFDERVYHSDP